VGYVRGAVDRLAANAWDQLHELIDHPRQQRPALGAVREPYRHLLDPLLSLKLVSLVLFGGSSLVEGKEAHMGRSTLLRALLLALITALAVLPASAFGAKPEIFHAHFLDTEEDVDVCGVIVDVVAEGVFTDKAFFDKEGNFVRFVSTASGKVTLTAENGKSVIIQFAQQFIEAEPIVDEEAGTITFVFTFKGLPEKIQTAHGPVLLRDAGILTFADTFDLETGEFISSEIIVNKGPHPEADSDFTLFCEVISEALA
jgi:hypothetical protein